MVWGATCVMAVACAHARPMVARFWKKYAARRKVNTLSVGSSPESSVHTETFNKNMELMGVIESTWNEVRRQHVFMEEQDRVLRSFFAQKKGEDTSGRPTGRGGGAEHLGRDVHAQNGRGDNH